MFSLIKHICQKLISSSNINLTFIDSSNVVSRCWVCCYYSDFPDFFLFQIKLLQSDWLEACEREKRRCRELLTSLDVVHFIFTHLFSYFLMLLSPVFLFVLRHAVASFCSRDLELTRLIMQTC